MKSSNPQDGDCYKGKSLSPLSRPGKICQFSIGCHPHKFNGSEISFDLPGTGVNHKADV